MSRCPWPESVCWQTRQTSHLKKCFATGCVALLYIRDVSFEVKEEGSFKNLLFSPQCPVWGGPPVFGRILFISTIWICSLSFFARACRWEWSATRHSCGETTWAFSRAHRRACAIAEWLIRRVHEIRYWDGFRLWKALFRATCNIVEKTSLQMRCAMLCFPSLSRFCRLSYTLHCSWYKTYLLYWKFRVNNNIKCDLRSEIK